MHRDGSIARTIDGISFFDDTLAKGGNYDYQIVAIDTAGERSTPASGAVRTDNTNEAQYLLNTKFQGAMHPLEFKLNEHGLPAVKLAEMISADDTQLWTLTAQGDSYCRMQKVSASSGSSLAIIDNQPIQMIDIDLQSDQLWHIIVLDC